MPATDHSKPRLFDLTLNLGDALTFISLVITAMSAYFALSTSVDKLHERVGDLQSQIGEVNERLDNMAHR